MTIRRALPAVPIALAVLALLAVAAGAGERVVVNLKDGSVIKGELAGPSDADPLALKTSFGDLSLPAATVDSVYVQKSAPPAAAPEKPTAAPEKPTAAPEEPEAAPGDKPAAKSKAGQRITAEPPVDEADTSKLLNMEDEDLINLLQKSGHAEPETVKTPNGPPKAPVKKLYSFEDEKGALLPPELTELELPKKKKPAKAEGAKPGSAEDATLTQVDAQLSAIVGGGKTEPGDGKPKPAGDGKQKPAGDGKPKPAGDGKPKPAADGPAKTAEVAVGTTEVAAGTAPVALAQGTNEIQEYVPAKGSMDGKIYKQFKKHGGVTVSPDDLGPLKANEIDDLLKKHLPAEGTLETNLKQSEKTGEVKIDGK